MHHEIPSTLGVPRDHGATGAFVSKWVVDEETLEVLHGDDLIKTISRQVGGQWVQVPAGDPALTIGRLCSADLPRGGGLLRRGQRAGYPAADLHGR